MEVEVEEEEVEEEINTEGLQKKMGYGALVYIILARIYPRKIVLDIYPNEVDQKICLFKVIQLEMQPLGKKKSEVFLSGVVECRGGTLLS